MNKDTGSSTVLFYRDFKGFTGGHLKVWDYYQRVQSYALFDEEIYFSAESSWKNNPWSGLKKIALKEWNPKKTDILFLAGLDWLALSEQQRKSPSVPVVNFIQGIRHADKNNPLYEFLKFPATRVCVSQEVADAIESTGLVNGPIIVNPNGLDYSLFPKQLRFKSKDIQLLIVGLKNTIFAKKLSEKLLKKGIECTLINVSLPRKDFLLLLSRSKSILFLPKKVEGFYLPALEAMYLHSLVICPDCIGNRSFCIDGITCFSPQYLTDSILLAVEKSLLLPKQERSILIKNAYDYAKVSTLEKERENFLSVLHKSI